MNQDQVKDCLLRLEEPATDFSVVFSGKKSAKVHGLYKPLTHEILLHNKNFQNEGQLLYTAIHEYAHHLHGERRPYRPGLRAHTNDFWSLFHGLLEKAEELGLYRNLFNEDPDFQELTAKIRQLLPQNGQLMLQFGELIVRAEALCRDKLVRFEDYLDRALGLPRASAGSAMKAYALQVPADLGWDAMKVVAGIRKPELRGEAIDAFRAGKSPDSVKAILKAPSETDPLDQLAKERQRLTRTIATMQERLADVEAELARLGQA